MDSSVTFAMCCVPQRDLSEEADDCDGESLQGISPGKGGVRKQLVLKNHESFCC